MPVVLGRRYVEAPRVTPVRFGLLSAAQLAEETDPHWQGGIDFQPDVCEASRATAIGCPISSDLPTKPATSTGRSTVGAEPFAVYSWIRCSPVGSIDEWQARTAAALTNGEARAVERVFWTGDTKDGVAQILPHLAEDVAVTEPGSGVILQTAATNIVTGAPAVGVPFVEAIGLLEGALGTCYGGEGVIHAPRWTLAALCATEMVHREGQRMETCGGTRVAFGAGYVGTAPDGAAAPAGSAWLYGTGAVAVRRSPIHYSSSVEQSLDRTENTLVYVAERTYVVGWDCCHFALLADFGGFSPPLVAA